MTAVVVDHKQSANRHRIDSVYVQEHWLPVIGPTAFLIAGQLADLKDEDFVSAMSTALGVGDQRWHQALNRLVRYGLATVRMGDGVLVVTMLDRWPEAPVPQARYHGAES